MFSLMFVCPHFRGGGGVPNLDAAPTPVQGAYTPPNSQETCTPTLLSGGRYASYWNASLLQMILMPRYRSLYPGARCKPTERVISGTHLLWSIYWNISFSEKASQNCLLTLTSVQSDQDCKNGEQNRCIIHLWLFSYNAFKLLFYFTFNSELSNMAYKIICRMKVQSKFIDSLSWSQSTFNIGRWHWAKALSFW